jgi:hypothetical protein
MILAAIASYIMVNNNNYYYSSITIIIQLPEYNYFIKYKIQIGFKGVYNY